MNYASAYILNKLVIALEKTRSTLDLALSSREYALANNQLEPVQAQTYQPMLDQPYDISLQDQINAVDAQANAAIRASGQNPAAQAYIMSQAIEAKNKIKGEEFRANQSNEAQTYQNQWTNCWHKQGTPRLVNERRAFDQNHHAAGM